MTLKIDDEKSDSDGQSVESLKLVKSPKLYPGSTTNAIKTDKNQSSNNLATLKNLVTGGD